MRSLSWSPVRGGLPQVSDLGCIWKNIDACTGQILCTLAHYNEPLLQRDRTVLGCSARSNRFRRPIIVKLCLPAKCSICLSIYLFTVVISVLEFEGGGGAGPLVPGL
jgi:hypothetical protein